MTEFEHYKLLQKKLEAMEIECARCRKDFDQLTQGHRENRMDIDKMILALFGDDEMGLIGILDRFKSIEETIVRGRVAQMWALSISVSLGIIILMYLFIRFGV